MSMFIYNHLFMSLCKYFRLCYASIRNFQCFLRIDVSNISILHIYITCNKRNHWNVVNYITEAVFVWYSSRRHFDVHRHYVCARTASSFPHFIRLQNKILFAHLSISVPIYFRVTWIWVVTWLNLDWYK